MKGKIFRTKFSMFDRVKDSCNQSYIDYSSRIMLGTMYYKSIVGISSMQEMTRAFNDSTISRNAILFLAGDESAAITGQVIVIDHGANL